MKAVILAAMLSLVGKQKPDNQLLHVAHDIHAAVEAGHVPLETKERMALLMVVTAFRESGFRREVELCAVTGRSGERTLWQIVGLRYCPANRRATELALARFNSVKDQSERGLIAGYMGRRHADKEVNERLRLYEKVTKEAGL